MKIQYASDLHLEFHENSSWLKHHPLKVAGDILVLAGDIGYLGDLNYSLHPFWDWASDNYQQVIVCLGNHEFYKYYDISTLKDGFDLEIRPNVHAYYNKAVTIGNVDIVVSTMWSEIPEQDAIYTERYLSDFHRILHNGEFLTYRSFNDEHHRCLNFIKKAVSESTALHKIVVTHHVPSFRMQRPLYTGSRANGGFTVDLEDYITSSGINYWIYGHSHYNVDVKIGSTWCVSNQLGYVFRDEHLNFNAEKVVEV